MSDVLLELTSEEALSLLDCVEEELDTNKWVRGAESPWNRQYVKNLKAIKSKLGG
jgi:hypothetical protein